MGARERFRTDSLISCACCVFPPRRFSSQGRRPQNGSANTGKLNYFIVRRQKRSNGTGPAKQRLAAKVAENAREER